MKCKDSQTIVIMNNYNKKLWIAEMAMISCLLIIITMMLTMCRSKSHRVTEAAIINC